MNPESIKVYRLDGASLQAAKDVHKAMHSPTQTLGGDDFVHEYQGELKIIGLMSKSVQVTLQDGALPRAYARTPLCYVGPTGDYYVVAPVDYMDRHFVPRDGILLKDEEISKTGLWLGGWGDAEPMIARPYAAYGVNVPADFDEKVHLSTRLSAKFNYSGAFFRSLERVKQHFCDGTLVPWLSENQVTLKYDLSCDKERKPLLRMAAYRKDNGQAVDLRSNGWISVEKSHGDFYVLRPNIKSAGGMVLQASLDEIPEMASVETLWREQNDKDREWFVMPPPLPLELLHTNPKAPWPFPKSAPAP